MSTTTEQSVLPVLSYDEASPETQQIFDNLKQAVGRVPNLYATQGHSAKALGAKLALDKVLSTASYSGLEKEAIALAVSQVNGCNYCLAAHTAMAQTRGASESETFNFRRGTSNDSKLAALVALARDITEKRGHPAREKIDAFFAAGYDRAALVELIGLVALNVWNNYTNHIAGIPVDFPQASTLD